MKQKLFFLITILSIGFCHVHAQKFAKDVVTLKRDYDTAIRKFGSSMTKTPRLTGKDKGHAISVNVSGWDELVIKINDGGDSHSFDQSVIGDAKLTSKDGKIIYLSDLKPTYAKCGWGTLQNDKNVLSNPIAIRGDKFSKGIGLHASAEVIYPLNSKFTRFEGVVGVDNSAKGNGSVQAVFSPKIMSDEIREVKTVYSHQIQVFEKIIDEPLEEWLVAKKRNYKRGVITKRIGRLYKDLLGVQQLNADLLEGSFNIEKILDASQRISMLIEAHRILNSIDVTAIQLAFKDMAKMEGFPSDKYQDWVNKVPSIIKEAQQELAKGDMSQIEVLRKQSQMAKKMLLSNPLLKEHPFMVTKRYLSVDKARSAMGGSLGLPPSNFQNSSEVYSPATGWNNEFVKLRVDVDKLTETPIYKPKKGMIIADPELHFDGDKLMFSSIGTNNRWHLFELDLKSGISKQLTPESYEDFDSFNGCYTKDGQYIFTSTATFLGLPCTNGGNKMSGLFIFDPKTGKSRQLTYDQDSNWEPVMMNNGQIMYQRWEYADLPHSNSRIMFSMNPDGTTQKALYGSNSYFPNAMFYARPIPNKGSQFVAVVGGHHSVSRSGRLMIFDPMKGTQEAEGVVTEIPHRGKKVYPIVRDRLPDGVWPHFLHPFPLNDNYLLVSAKLRPDALWGVYLVDVYNNMTLIKEEEGYAILEPHSLKPRAKVPTIPNLVVEGEKEATVYLQDVYFGGGLKDIPRGTVKKLRIGSYHFSPMTQGGLLGTIGMDGPWDIRRILGTVDVEEDGSAMFKVPANTPIFVQPLDEDGKALQVMRSWFTAMPGETLSCIGCHEDARSTPLPKRTKASQQAPKAIKEWYGKERGFSFKHEVQPILDRACVACHNENNGDIPYLKGDVQEKGWKSSIGGRAWGAYGGAFSKSYVNLHRYIRRPGIEGDMHMLVPMDVHADQTELMRMLNKGHYGVELTTEETERLACWIDFNAPYHGARVDIPLSEHANRYMDQQKKYAEMFQYPIIDFSYLPEIPKNITPVKPNLPSVTKGVDKIDGWPIGYTEGLQLGSGIHLNRVPREIPITDDVVLSLKYIPKGDFIMGSERAKDEMPKTKVSIDKGYWIGTYEVTNELYALYDPTHDSRHEHRHGYQFGVKGYPLNEYNQPVCRISWKDAMGFCEWLSKRTGSTFTLPTEAQWEWAARAGKDTPFFFGAADADFSKYANLGDITLKEYASCSSHKFYDGVKVIDNASKYDDWVPRDTTYDDRGFVSEKVGRYRPNAWGVHDTHGNVAEWTRSLYEPYPYEDEDGRNDIEKSGRRVVRGGSWYDRPFRCTSSFREAYRDYQKVFNVGFRVIMEEKSNY